MFCPTLRRDKSKHSKSKNLIENYKSGLIFSLLKTRTARLVLRLRDKSTHSGIEEFVLQSPADFSSMNGVVCGDERGCV